MRITKGFSDVPAQRECAGIARVMSFRRAVSGNRVAMAQLSTPGFGKAPELILVDQGRRETMELGRTQTLVDTPRIRPWG